MRIRQPLPRSWRIGLGFLSVVLLVVGYGWLAHTRQVRKRAMAQEQLVAARQQLQDLISRSASTRVQDAESNQFAQARLRETIARLERESRSAVDRTVPTWRSLYHDGLVRIVTPQGLGGREYWLWEDAKATFSRLACGLAVGILLASIIGLAMGCYSAIEAFLLPPLSFLAQIPPTAMLAVFFVLVGTQFPMFVTIIAFGMLPTLAQTIYQSAKNDVPDELINKADTLGASEFELIWEVIMRQILPRVIDAVRLQIGPALVLLVAAEWMVAGEGFGYRLRLFFQRTDMTVVFVYLFILGIFGFLLDTALVGLRRLRCPWFGE
jgi:NitT/TauT family transport system permease protein